MKQNTFNSVGTLHVYETERLVTFKNEIKDIVDQQMKSGRKTRAEVVDIVSKVTLELYKTFWLRRSFWTSQIKNV